MTNLSHDLITQNARDIVILAIAYLNVKMVKMGSPLATYIMTIRTFETNVTDTPV